MQSKVLPTGRKIIAASFREDLAVAAREEDAEPRTQPIVICDYLPLWREMVKRILGLPCEAGARIRLGALPFGECE